MPHPARPRSPWPAPADANYRYVIFPLQVYPLPSTHCRLHPPVPPKLHPLPSITGTHHLRSTHIRQLLTIHHPQGRTAIAFTFTPFQPAPPPPLHSVLHHSLLNSHPSRPHSATHCQILRHPSPPTIHPSIHAGGRHSRNDNALSIWSCQTAGVRSVRRNMVMREETHPRATHIKNVIKLSKRKTRCGRRERGRPGKTHLHQTSLPLSLSSRPSS